MFNIITDRLEIIPLSKEMLEKSSNDFNFVEERFGLKKSCIDFSERFKKILLLRFNEMKDTEYVYTWSTFWVIALLEENRIIGNIMIKGYPNKDGEVIVGYSLEANYRGLGYMPEALEGLIKWIFANQDVKYIVAGTLKDNIPSQRVLKKLRMKVYREDDECFWWRLEKGDY
ncbi:GNAT family N-acetyltransferase [Candidatus Clostridium radicumherbarum]|uniref:GNAT family N-acetyltransferase n=1 Tax=Candidatus Clostridium radicumherbarum TaxID=3381662 RepID=A0ABW8TXG0_9CLOT